LLVDAAEFEGAAGEVRLVSPENVAGITLSTHMISLSLLARIIQDRTTANVMILGVQPKVLEFGEGLSPELEKASTRISRVLLKVLRESLG
jgi:hydrogenase 3 maturation protease